MNYFNSKYQQCKDLETQSGTLQKTNGRHIRHSSVLFLIASEMCLFRTILLDPDIKAYEITQISLKKTQLITGVMKQTRNKSLG